MKLSINNLRDKLQQKDPEYTNWKAETTRALQADTANNEPIRDRMKTDYRAMIKGEWEAVGENIRELVDELETFSLTVVDKVVEQIEDDENGENEEGAGDEE